MERVKQRAYSNLKDLKPFDTTTHSLRKTLTGGVQEDEQYGGPDQVPQQFDIPIPIPQAQQGIIIWLHSLFEPPSNGLN